jgi:hypothetical protein
MRHASRRSATDDNRLAPQFRIIELLDRGIEGVHVRMRDNALPSCRRAARIGIH